MLRLDRNGAEVGSARVLDDGVAESSWPSVAWDGESRFLVAHRVQRTAAETQIELRAMCF